MKTPSLHPVLSIDPGLRELGYAVHTGDRLLDAGVLSLQGVPPLERLAVVRRALLPWSRAHRPRTLVVEHIPKRPLDQLAGLPALGRLLRRVAKAQRMTLATYSACTARRALLGNGWAGKREVAEAMAV